MREQGPKRCQSGHGRGWAMAVGAEQPPSARPGERCKRQASVAQRHQPFCRRPRVYTENRFFSFIAIGKRRLRHRMRLIALSTMVCSDLANSSASFCNSKSKSGAPWRAGTGCHACTPVHEYGAADPVRRRRGAGSDWQGGGGRKPSSGVISANERNPKIRPTDIG